MLLLLCGLFLLPYTVATPPNDDETLIQEHCSPLWNNGVCNLECLEESETRDIDGHSRREIGDCIRHPVEMVTRSLDICFESSRSRKEWDFTAVLVTIALQSKLISTSKLETYPKCGGFFFNQSSVVTEREFEAEVEILKQDIFSKFHESASIHSLDLPRRRSDSAHWTYLLACFVFLFLIVLSSVGVGKVKTERTRKRRIINHNGNWRIPLEGEIDGGEPKRAKTQRQYPSLYSEYGTSIAPPMHHHPYAYGGQYQYNYASPAPGHSYRNPAIGYDYGGAPRIDPYAHYAGQFAPVWYQPEVIPPLPVTPPCTNPRPVNGAQLPTQQDQMSIADTYSSQNQPTEDEEGPTKNSLFLEAMRGGISTPINPLEVNSDLSGVYPIHAVVSRPAKGAELTREEEELIISDLGKILDAGGEINMKTAISQQYNPNKMLKDEETALMIAVSRQLHRVAVFLLSRGACQWQINRFDSVCLHEAIGNRDVRMVEMLLQWHMKDPMRDELIDGLRKIESVDFNNRTPLMCCAREVDGDKMARLLIEMGGADINNTGDEDSRKYTASTVLHYAVQYDNLPLMDYLLNLDNIHEIINSKDIHGRTAVYLCCHLGNGEALKKLLDKGASHVEPAHRYGQNTRRLRDLKRETFEYNHEPEDAAASSGAKTENEILDILEKHEEETELRIKRKLKRKSDPLPQRPVPERPPRAATVGVANDGGDTPIMSNGFENRIMNQTTSNAVAIPMPDVGNYIPNYMNNQYNPYSRQYY